MIRYLKFIIVVAVLMVILLLPTGVFAANFITCDLNGVPTGNSFSNVTITVSDFDTTGNYKYVGIDAAVFGKPSDYDPAVDEWESMPTASKRIYTNSTIIDFNDMTGGTYESNKVYTVAYRVLYTLIGSSSDDIVETEWKKVRIDVSPTDVLYFKSIMGITQFTDRVIGSNKWIEEEKAKLDTQAEKDAYENYIISKGLNKYFPNSEVVSKFVLNPGGADVTKYNITFDTNSDPSIENVDNLGIDYIRIVKVINGTVSAPVEGTRTGSKLTFDIEGSGTNEVTVYVKYKFKNEDINTMPDEFRNKVTVKADMGSGLQPFGTKVNTIRLRKAIPEIR